MTDVGTSSPSRVYRVIQSRLGGASVTCLLSCPCAQIAHVSPRGQISGVCRVSTRPARRLTGRSHGSPGRSRSRSSGLRTVLESPCSPPSGCVRCRMTTSTCCGSDPTRCRSSRSPAQRRSGTSWAAGSRSSRPRTGRSPGRLPGAGSGSSSCSASARVPSTWCSTGSSRRPDDSGSSRLCSISSRRWSTST